MNVDRESRVETLAKAVQYAKHAGIILLVLSPVCFILFCIVTHFEEKQCMSFGEGPYDSIGSSYLFLVPLAVFLPVAALGVRLIVALAEEIVSHRAKPRDASHPPEARRQ